MPLSARERKISKVSESWIRINVKDHDNLHQIDFNKERIKYRKAEKDNEEKEKKGVNVEKVPIPSANIATRRIKTANRATGNRDLKIS